MKNYFFFYLCTVSLLSLISSCATEPSPHSTKAIPVIEVNGLIHDTTFLDSASLFIPETKQDALIHGVDRVVETEGRFFILDAAMQQVLCYAQSGKHLFTIHRVGDGPGEYINLFDMAIDKKENKLLLLAYPPAIHYYTLDGNYERTEKLKSMCKSLAVTDRYIYLRKETYANKKLSDYSVWVMEKESRRCSSLWKPLPEIAPFCSSGKMQMTGNDPVYLTRKFDNTIYTMREDEIEEAYAIDWGNKAFPVTDKGETYTCEELNEMCREKKYVYTMTDLCDTPDYLLFRTNQPGLCVLSKEKKEVKRYRIIMNTNYQLAMPDFIPVESKGKRIFFVYPASMLKMSSPEDGHVNAKLSRLLEQISEEDNPVFFSYSIK